MERNLRKGAWPQGPNSTTLLPTCFGASWQCTRQQKSLLLQAGFRSSTYWSTNFPQCIFNLVKAEACTMRGPAQKQTSRVISALKKRAHTQTHIVKYIYSWCYFFVGTWTICNKEWTIHHMLLSNGFSTVASWLDRTIFSPGKNVQKNWVIKNRIRDYGELTSPDPEFCF